MPYQAPPACTGGSGASNGAKQPALGVPTIGIAPQSALLSGASAGARAISLIPLSLVDPYVRQTTTPWFAVGQTITIDPGAKNQETATIARLSPLTLAAPLRFSHTAGEMVSVLVPSRSPAAVGAGDALRQHQQAAQPPTGKERDVVAFSWSATRVDGNLKQHTHTHLVQGPLAGPARP